MLCELIIKEVVNAKKTYTAIHIARVTKTNGTTAWRYLNDISKMPFSFVYAMEKAGLIKPLKSLFSGDNK